MISILESDPVTDLPSVYFSHRYGIADLPNGGRWVMLTDQSGGWMMPLVLVPIRGTSGLEARSPYGYSGIFVETSLSDGRVREYWAESIDVLRELGVISLFLRFSPFDLRSADRFPRWDDLHIRHASDTFLVATPTSQSVWSSMQGRARTSIRKAESHGLSAELRSAEPPDLVAEAPFRVLYEGTMKRVRASEQYFFPDSYYGALGSGPDESLLICTVRNREGEAVAASLVLADESLLHYHLSGSSPQGAQMGANSLLIWEILKASVRRGASAVHLGGGVFHEDGLHKFKASFGGQPVPFKVGTFVLDELEYLRLVDARAEELGLRPATILRSDYFPAFRAVGDKA